MLFGYPSVCWLPFWFHRARAPEDPACMRWQSKLPDFDCRATRHCLRNLLVVFSSLRNSKDSSWSCQSRDSQNPFGTYELLLFDHSWRCMKENVMQSIFLRRLWNYSESAQKLEISDHYRGYQRTTSNFGEVTSLGSFLLRLERHAADSFVSPGSYYYFACQPVEYSSLPENSSDCASKG